MPQTKPKIRFTIGEKQLCKLSTDGKVTFKQGDQEFEIALVPWIRMECYLVDQNHPNGIPLTESTLEHLTNGVPETDKGKMN